MERVQFQQEQMLAELQDLVEKGLFTVKETKEIIKRRTAFETALVRRVARKADYLRYAAYEMKLEQLRRKRVERLKLPPSPPSVSDYALVRRQFQILERALRKFKADVALWIQYRQIAKREGARTLVGRITARALQLHPNVPALYILAASHEMEHLSPSAARTLLQRGIRLNSDSVEMWREYVKMELGFIESLRRRWDVLGIEVGGEGKGKGKQKDADLALEADNGLSDTEKMIVDEDVEGDESESARVAIMEGAIVRSVMANAAKAIPKIALFDALQSVISRYPSPPTLRQGLLGYLFDLLRSALPFDAQALKLYATRNLASAALEDESFVDTLKDANEEVLRAVPQNGQAEEGVLQVYADFVEEWCDQPIDDNLKLYLISSLRSLVRPNWQSPSLLSAHLRLVTKHGGLLSSDAEKVLRIARKYTGIVPKSARVWLARLDVEKEHGTRETVSKAWSDARASVEGDSVVDVWIWGLEQHSDDALEDQKTIHEALLRESMRNSSLSDVHDLLLMRYIGLVIRKGRTNPVITLPDDRGKRRIEEVRRMAGTYLMTAKVWAEVFSLESKVDVESGADVDVNGRVLEEVYRLWRRRDGVNATLRWAEWLLHHGKAKEAKDVVMGARSLVDRDGLERRWAAMLDEAPGRGRLGGDMELQQ